MGRHHEFNREEVLSRAMNVFWQKGYKGTSMKDLVKITGLQPGSIYNSFGDKHELFREAVKHYGEVVTSRMIDVLYAGGSPLGNIRHFFENIINTPNEKRAMGCLLSNTVVELAPHDKDIGEVVAEIMQRIEEAFFYCLEAAIAEGELPPDTDTRSLSLYLSTFTHGLIVTGKSSPDPERMGSIVDFIMSKIT